VLLTLLAGIRSNIVAIAIVMYVMVQQRIAKCGQVTARQHTTTPIGRAKERRLNKLEFVRRLLLPPPHNQRQYRGPPLHHQAVGEAEGYHLTTKAHQPSFP